MVRVYVADGHGLARYGIVRALNDCPDFEIVGEASNGREAAHELPQLAPDVAVVAQHLPGLDGLDLVRLVREDCETKVVLLSGEPDPPAVYAALAAGAAGYLSTDTTEDRLREVVASAARDEPMLDPGIQRRLITEIREAGRDLPPALTPREQEVLALLAQGSGASEIAHHLHVGVTTIKKHLARLYEKLDARNSASAVAAALRHGLIE